MITASQITPIGSFGKPHGVNGEINLVVDGDIDIASLSCVVIEINGINVPFFFDSIRPRGNDKFLVHIDGIDSEEQVSALVNKEVYAIADEVEELPDIENQEDDGFYASDFIGFKVFTTDGKLSGTIMDVDDSTENYLFVIRTDEGRQVLVPVADEFITDIDIEGRTLELELPEGLLSI